MELARSEDLQLLSGDVSTRCCARSFCCWWVRLTAWWERLDLLLTHCGARRRSCGGEDVVLPCFVCKMGLIRGKQRDGQRKAGGSGVRPAWGSAASQLHLRNTRVHALHGTLL